MISILERGTLGGDFLQPIVQEMDLGAFRRQLGEVRALKNSKNRTASAFDLADRFLKKNFPCHRESMDALARVFHHQDIGAKLLERPGELGRVGCGYRQNRRDRGYVEYRRTTPWKSLI